MEKKDDRSIQILRAFGILLVCIHHTLNNLPLSELGSVICTALSRVDVVVFFIISGYLFEKKFFQYESARFVFLKRKTLQLVVPYLFWSLILYVAVKLIAFSAKLFSAVMNLTGFEPLTWKDIIFNILTYEGYYVQHLWYLYALFIIFVFMIYIKPKYVSVWAIIILLMISGLIDGAEEVSYIIKKIFKHLPDFMAGRLAYKYFNRNVIMINRGKEKIIICAAVFIYCITFARNNFIALPVFEFVKVYNRFELALHSWSFVTLLTFASKFISRNLLGGACRKLAIIRIKYI